MIESQSLSARIERGVVGILLAGLVIGCLLVVRPFIAAILWAAILAYATWPAFLAVERRLGVRRSTAALITILIACAVMLAPLVFVVTDFADDATSMVRNARDFLAAGLPGPPSWVASIPVIGARIDEQWKLIAADRSELEVLIAPYAQVLGRWGLDAGVNVGLGLAQGTLELALALFITFFFYRDGAALALRIQGGLARLAGERGLRLLDVAGNTVQAVVYGVVGTALVQAALMLIGLMIAGVPNAILLAFLVGITSPLPIGPPLVWIGSAIYLYLTDGIGWAVFMLVWGIALVSSADNIVRPLLIARGGTTPIVITLLGILGGVLAFGFLGLFLGPTLLAVGYSLLHEWTAHRDDGRTPPPPATPV